MSRKALLITPDLCIGCRACQVACKSWNGLPAERTRNRGTHENPPDLSGYTFNRIRFVEKTTPRGELRWYFVSQRCMHCGEPACVDVCPAGAMQKDEETGIVFYDKEECLGCKACLQACPFKIPRYDKQGKISKCHMCLDRVKAGLEPACAKTCPTDAITFGDRNKLIDQAKARGYRVYGETQRGGLGVLFAVRELPREYGLAERPMVRKDLFAIGEALRLLHAKGVPISESLVRQLFS